MTTTNKQQRTVAGAAEPGPDRFLRMRLLHRREEVAVAALEHTAHALPGADLLWQELHAVEECLRVLFPTIWTERYPQWIALDAARLHTPQAPLPDECTICEQQQQLSAPPQAS